MNTEHQRLGNQVKALLTEYNQTGAEKLSNRLHQMEADGSDFPEWLDNLWRDLSYKIEESKC